MDLGQCIVHASATSIRAADTGLGLATPATTRDSTGCERDQLLLVEDQYRIVPKRAQLRICPAPEPDRCRKSRLDPVMATGARWKRARILLGAEVGRYWIFDQKILDIFAYGSWSTTSCRISPTSPSASSQSITFQGIGESQYGADAGASASLSITKHRRIYITTTPNSRRHAIAPGTVGVEFKW